MNRKPMFENLLKVLERKTPDRPTLFEFFLNPGLYEYLAEASFSTGDFTSQYDIVIKAFIKAGYDYATLKGSDFYFPVGSHDKEKTISLNDRAVITNRSEFQSISWPDPADFDYSRLDKCRDVLPEGMKLIVWGPGGVLENVIDLTGYDNLCYMLAENRELVGDICEAVGTRLIKYYEICSKFDTVGALIGNDDWGFQSQTLISPDDLREFIFPYHKRIVDVIHSSGKPAILHSCGNLGAVWEDIIEVMRYDGKHSYEDKILPVEEAYAKYSDRIAIMGGIDMDFLCRSTPEAITERCRRMIKSSVGCRSYALGSGNSIPEYVPYDNFFAMTKAVLEQSGE